MQFLKHSFNGSLYVADVGRIEQGRPIRVVIQNFKLLISDQDDTFTLRIPVGYCSDGGSIPRLLRSVIQPWGRSAQAFVVHDILYSTNALPRVTADRILRESIRIITAHIVKGENEEDVEKYTLMGKCQAFLVFTAVRLFGGGGYRRGPEHYKDRADRVFKKTSIHDEGLAGKIKLTPDSLMPVVVSEAG